MDRPRRGVDAADHRRRDRLSAGRAWARRIEQRGQEPALLDEVQTLRDRVADLEQSVARMHEIEDRMDFAERMLTQRAESARLPEPGGR